MYNPVVIDEQGNRSYDIFSRLLKDRIVFLGTEVDHTSANSIVAQLLFLEAEDPDKPITLYINSPGGYVTSGWAIYDTMQYIKPEVSTVCVGLAASFGAVILAGGAKGKRYALPNAKIMIHQPLIGSMGRSQATDLAIHAEQILKTRKLLEKILSEHTGKDEEQIHKDMERDYYMSSKEAVEYGLIDEVLHEREGK